MNRLVLVAAAVLVAFAALLSAPQPASAQQQCVDRKGNAIVCPSQRWQGQPQGHTQQQGQQAQQVCKDAYGRVIACPTARQAETSQTYGNGRAPAEWSPYNGDKQPQEVPSYPELQKPPRPGGYVDQDKTR